MPKLPVRSLPTSDAGRLLVRLNVKYRTGISRYGIVELTNMQESKSLKVLVLGHDDDGAIYMPYDIRVALGVAKGADLKFSINKVGWLGKILWLLKTPDPAVHVPAWLALISVFLGFLGVFISLFG